LIHHHVFPNGLALVAESMPAVQSGAFTLLLPAGAVYEPADRCGLAAMTAEWISRGAGGRDSRELLGALDSLGINHSEGAQTVHTSVACATFGRNLLPALELFADIVLRPHLDDDEVEPIQSLAVQSLQSLEDDPGSKVIYELRKRYYPDPWGRSAPGTVAGIEAATPDDLRTFYHDHYRPDGAILAVAGAVEWEPLVERVGQLFGGWTAGDTPSLVSRETGPRRSHIEKDTQQIQIALAYKSVPFGQPSYYEARAATAILGGYSSARLFAEVREKRGLCYSVYAGHDTFKDRASVLCYAGTSADRAQETLDVTLAEIRRLSSGGIELEELQTMRAGLKSSLIMQQESTMSRSASLAGDWYYLRRVRSLDEIAAALDALSVESINAYLASQDFSDLTILTLGPAPLKFPD
jgi:predicted Zn-dependent peptidase